MTRLRSSLTACLALVAVLALGACDTTDDTALDVFVVDFNFPISAYESGSEDPFRATYDAVDARVDRGDLDNALETAGDGALVMLYIDVELVSAAGSADNGTWAALPLTRGFDQVVFGDSDGDGTSDGDIIVTGLLASYEYSFDNDDLYFEVQSSLPFTDFGTDDRAFFDVLVPQRRLEGEVTETIDLRLVVIPDELFFVDGAGARIDMRDYQAVKRAYNLPD